MKYGYGVDLGGTTVKIAYFDEIGNMIEKWEIPTVTANGGQQILSDIAASIAAHRAGKDHEILGIGIGVPGPVNGQGEVSVCVNLGWGRFNVSQALSELTGLPVTAGNDANVAAMGEFWKGGGQGCRNMIFVTLGTGVGGGVIIEGRLLHGHRFRRGDRPCGAEPGRNRNLQLRQAGLRRAVLLRHRHRPAGQAASGCNSAGKQPARCGKSDL